MKVLKVIGWIFIPYIMILLTWKKLGNFQRTIALIWIIIILVSACGNKTEQPTQPIKGQSVTQETTKNESVDKAKVEVKDKKQDVATDTKAQQYITAKVTRVVDGDTIDVDISGKKETIRMILVDTPETKHPDKPVQPFGNEASQFTKETLEGKEIKLEKDVTERDRYGRLLMYVYVGDKMFNELLLEKGLARVAVYPPDVKYVDKFREIQKKAQEQKNGIWSIENYATDKGFDETIVKKEEPKEIVKQVEQPKQETKIQETPKPTTNTNISYKNCTEVKNAGKAPLYEGDPGYSRKLDRDGDGVACER